MPSAAILAGGAARRMQGRDKSRLLIDGATILHRQIAELSQITDDIMLVGASKIEPAVGVRPVIDRVPDAGPLGGLDAALTAAHGNRVAVVACDMPFISARFLAYLLSLAGDAEAVVPRTRDGYHPLCAVYTRDCLEAVRCRLTAGTLSMMGLLDEVRVRVVQEHEFASLGDPDRLLANVNTPDDLERIAAFAAHEP
jgi:molybdenum cofactor guanylyltransferase